MLKYQEVENKGEKWKIELSVEILQWEEEVSKTEQKSQLFIDLDQCRPLLVNHRISSDGPPATL